MGPGVTKTQQLQKIRVWARDRSESYSARVRSSWGRGAERLSRQLRSLRRARERKEGMRGERMRGACAERLLSRAGLEIDSTVNAGTWTRDAGRRQVSRENSEVT